MDDECRTKLTHAASWNESVYKDDVDYFLCSACKIIINDEFYLRVGSKIYHESCLQCAICHIALDEKSTCFLRGVHILCQQDYYKYIINKCSKCNRFIYPHDWVRRACEHTYHLTCFACYKCGRQLSTGEEYAWENNSILCKIHVIEGSKEKYDANKQSETKRIRTAFSLEQLKILQDNFKVDPNPDGQDLRWIAQFTGLSKRVTQIWFQNTRARQKKVKSQRAQQIIKNYKRNKYKINNRAKEISQDPKLVDLVWKIAKRSVNLSSILIAAAGLITKWLLIQPIHNELVYKYRTNQSLYFVPYAFLSLLLYQVVIQLCAKVFPQLTAIEDSFQLLADLFSSMFFPQPENNDGESVSPSTSNFPVPHLIGPYTAAVFLTLTLIVIQSLILLANVRRNSIQSYRGDDTEIPRRHRSEYVSYAVRNFHFAAHFIGYFIWGFILIAVFSLIICIALDGFITYESVPLVDKTLKLTMPSLLFIFFKVYINKILAQHALLQHHGEVLSLNNCPLLTIIIYFNFFLDAVLGFIFSVMRLIQTYLNQLNMNEIRYINDDDQDSSKRRLSVYTRRMPIALSSIVSDDYMKSFEMYQF
ncbi:unnamed protein product [Rotaria socialis]|uniref:Uncharacterized protein n=1 Tax=Rotaria socialis TaxID=392032 RepID=A0A817XQ97_9BILA|nr:unnamed protein product [Rotaria socialis]